MYKEFCHFGNNVSKCMDVFCLQVSWYRSEDMCSCSFRSQRWEYYKGPILGCQIGTTVLCIGTRLIFEVSTSHAIFTYTSCRCELLICVVCVICLYMQYFYWLKWLPKWCKLIILSNTILFILTCTFRY